MLVGLKIETFHIDKCYSFLFIDKQMSTVILNKVTWYKEVAILLCEKVSFALDKYIKLIK